MPASATDALEVVRTEIGDPDDWRDRERLIETELHYADGTQVVVRIRKRGHRFDLDDEGAAVRKARARGVEEWEEVATEIVDDHDLNLNRRGVISVPGVDDSDLAWLAYRVTRCSYALHSELLDTLD